MTKNLLQIVPYISTHGKIILANQMNHVLMDKDAQYEGDAMQLEQNGLAYTCIINNEPINGWTHWETINKYKCKCDYFKSGPVCKHCWK